jgi:hypothetical protein
MLSHIILLFKINQMQYTAGELRKMNGRKCKFQYRDKPEAE